MGTPQSPIYERSNSMTEMLFFILGLTIGLLTGLIGPLIVILSKIYEKKFNKEKFLSKS